MEDKITAGERIDVIKLDTAGNKTWRYQGTVVSVSPDSCIIEAFFDREDTLFHGICLCKGDRFVETYFSKKWFNIFEIHDRDDDRIKGWYCNISTPAELNGPTLTYTDLALDVLVYPDGKYEILDQDEFETSVISSADRKQAEDSLNELIERLKTQGIIKR